ncbi:Amino acid adenylation domain protein OS=Tsukamurella paurometabola (strain ATCC 8368 / DSM/ CCUG 35730 / CIP 100753 / JCM 10117 / KCTC 9821 / NBRC 16120/ NCIMB 702349 / NCTC 13040) OX=521096 GN=Tpau_4326 PE=4 SV=1 [Tsukamurella paurometabola]|uniref:Phenyloxazoline synthase MbtB n=1 Tax=Tsukamurella paurometabola (strain ATCC 8368 / DSM 20162 / CCUG 35730 / CIP 100753 / JCM 10117 / KCTC 9821 / NBRC 16120 / NCIMB 702349 / NCTC 13040) TaxID=521096 RepID=D5UZ40_TSUPD|nr:non-ribosomal peptide synthetase [Tsukamurella paurometabola]ADG80887.1 amino acid adenylation domain protein [Tsukamurella paurometabola DSM 20162]SUQ39253.1 Phenyloxazoline synthase MbtB [Tsukamurella paurometabola]
MSEPSSALGTDSAPAIGLDEVRATIAAALDLPVHEVTPDADLIGLGLDSLRMMALAGGWRKRGVAINFARLAAEPTAAAWASLLAAAPAVPLTPDPAPAPPAPPADPTDAFALAPMAHAYWAGRQAAELGSVAAHLSVEFDGAGVDPDRLRDAVHSVAQAHPQLRARILPDGTQRIGPDATRVSVVDLRGADAARVRAELDRLRDERTHQLLDIAAGRMWDVTLTLLPEGASRLHVDVDMIAADAVSYRILMRDLAAAYRGEAIAAPDYRYRDYLDRPPVDAAVRADDERFWRARVPELPGAPELPLSAAGRAGTALRVRRMHHRVDGAGKAAIEAAARTRGVTPAMALASVFAATVARWSAADRFLLNLPLFDREPVHPDIDGVVGDFTSSVLLDVDGTAPVTAEALQRTLHRNAAHGTVGGVEVLRMLGRAQGRQVLAPVVYTSAIGLGELFDPTVTATFGTAGHIVSQGPQVLLDAQVTEFDGGLLLNWDIRADAFEDGVADAMFEHYRASLRALADGTAAPGLPADQVRRRAEANATAHDAPPRTLHGRFFAAAAARPDAPAVLGDGAPLTYGELAAAALRVAGALRADGIGAGDAVAIHLPKGPGQVIAVLGVLAAGAHYVPVGYAQPPARRAAILAGSGARMLLDGEALAAALARDTAAPDPADTDPAEVAYVLYTSGSTGVPKGVEVSHDAATNTIDDLVERFALGPADRTLGVSALEFDLSVFDLFAPLSVGGAVVVMAEEAKADPAAWLDLTVRHAVTVVNAVPAVLDLLLARAHGSATGVPALRAVLLGGDRVCVDLIERTRAVAPAARFAGLGGATEAAIHSTVREVTGPAPAHWDCVPYGRPLRNVRCRVVDGASRDRPDHVPGELWIGGRSVALGYRGDPERTADRFVEVDGVRWYRTGDRGRYDGDGGIDFLGRADNQVKVRGHRVELGEVESALRSAPGVDGAIVRVVGEAHRAQLVAAVTGDSPAELDPAAVLAVVAAAVPGYMVPARVRVLDAFPLTGNGKTDRAAIGALLAGDAERAPARAPGSALERALLALVIEVIGADPADPPGVDDDFFALGGDSVQATALVAAIRDWLDAPAMTIAQVFAGRTVAGIATAVAEHDDPARLDAVAEVYLEVSALGADELAELIAAETAEAAASDTPEGDRA